MIGVPTVLSTTSVNGQEAVWVQGPHFLYLENGSPGEVRFTVEGNVLIWVEGEITYRLETGLSLEEAVRIAGSLR